MLYYFHMKTKFRYPLDGNNNEILKVALLDIEKTITARRYTKRYLEQTLMLSEEIITKLLQNSTEGELRLSISTNIWESIVKISAPGKEISLKPSGIEAESETEIRDTLLAAYQDKIDYKFASGYNSVRLTIGVKAQTLAFESAVAIVLGVGVYLFNTYALSPAAGQYLTEHFYKPASDIVLNLLQMLLLPVVFLSIMAVVSKLSDTKKMESSVGRQTILATIVTSNIATLIGIFSFKLFDSFIPESAYGLEGMEIATTGNMSLSDVIFSLVPQNIFSPFIENNILQVIFLAVVFGVCINLVGEHSDTFINANNALIELTNKVVEGIAHVTPIGIFCATIITCKTYGLTYLLSLIVVITCLVIAFIGMSVIYLASVGGLMNLNPITFIRKIRPLVRELLLSGSGMDALPQTMRFCKTKLGVPSSVYSVSLPIGAQFNLDGSCIYMAVLGLYLAKVNGIVMFGNSLIPMIFSIVVLSIGAPNMTGSNIVCLLTLLTSIGIPKTAIGAVLCLDPIISIGIAVINTIGDLVVSIAIAKKQGNLDKNVYNRM